MLVCNAAITETHNGSYTAITGEDVGIGEWCGCLSSRLVLHQQ